MAVPLYRLVRSNDLAGWVIRVATRSRWNHVQIPMDDGTYLGAHPGGLGPEDESVGHTVYGQVTAAQYGAYLACARALVGTGYGWADIVSIGLLQYGIRPKFIRDRVRRTDRLICSQAVDLCASAAGLHLFADGRLSMDVSPGDLANLGTLNVGVYIRSLP